MKILSLDTSAEHCSVAVLRDDRLVGRETLAGIRHSEIILAMVEEVLEEAAIPLNQLDGIAFGRGPGSFTGIRIACGVAQGLAFGSGLKVVGIDTLSALAERSGAEKVVACLDARMGEVYHAAYELKNGRLSELIAPGLYLPQNVPDIPEGQWVACGSGFLAHGETLEARYEGRISRVMTEIFPRAHEMARLAAIEFDEGKGQDASCAQPLYVRNKVALKESER